MPDEIGWLTPEDEAMLDEARAEALKECPETPEDEAETARRCDAAKAYRLKQERRRRRSKKRGKE